MAVVNVAAAIASKSKAKYKMIINIFFPIFSLISKKLVRFVSITLFWQLFEIVKSNNLEKLSINIKDVKTSLDIKHIQFSFFAVIRLVV